MSLFRPHGKTPTTSPPMSPNKTTLGVHPVELRPGAKWDRRPSFRWSQTKARVCRDSHHVVATSPGYKRWRTLLPLLTACKTSGGRGLIEDSTSPWAPPITIVPKALRFDQNVEWKRPAGAYPLHDFHKICRVCTSFQDELAVKISSHLLKGLWSYGGFKLMLSGFCQTFNSP